MNLANKISLSRLIMAFGLIVTFTLTVLGIAEEKIGWIIILVLFVLGSISDFVDGKIARSQNMITTFGKFIDPIADKILVNSTLFLTSSWIVFEFWNEEWNIIRWVPLLCAVMMLIRDIAVDASRMMCAAEGKIVHASIYGKLKTIIQMVSLVALLTGIVLYISSEHLSAMQCTGETIIVYAIFGMVIATVASWIAGIDYIKKSKDILFKSM